MTSLIPDLSSMQMIFSKIRRNNCYFTVLRFLHIQNLLMLWLTVYFVSLAVAMMLYKSRFFTFFLKLGAEIIGILLYRAGLVFRNHFRLHLSHTSDDMAQIFEIFVLVDDRYQLVPCTTPPLGPNFYTS